MIQLTYPDLGGLPMRRRVPFELQIETVTRPMYFDDTYNYLDVDLFPMPPARASDVDIYVEQSVHLQHRHKSGGMVFKIPCAQTHQVEVGELERRWCPDEEAYGEYMGKWEQSRTFRFLAGLLDAPSFRHDLLEVKVRKHSSAPRRQYSSTLLDSTRCTWT